MRSGLCLGLFFSAMSITSADEPVAPKSGKYWVYIGTYTGAKSKGIYRCELDLAIGKLSTPELAVEVGSPSFLAVHPSNKFLYAVGETGEFKGQKTGSVHAFSLDSTTGGLMKLNSESSGGPGPCHIVVDAQGKNALVANYGGGSAAVLPIRTDGGLKEASSFVQHKGKSVDPGRQEAPHAHSINIDPSGRFVVVADLGLDQVLVYKFDSEKGAISANDPPFLKVADAAGPRHFAFHRTKPFAYVINELTCKLDALKYTTDGKFEITESVSTLPSKFEKGFSTAEVVVHPSGKFVYGSNRGHHSIVGFKIDQETGKLTLIGHQGEGIKTPRNFNIDPTGKYMIVANQDGDSIVLFEINQETGELKKTGVSVEVGTPVCIKFVPKPE